MEQMAEFSNTGACLRDRQIITAAFPGRRLSLSQEVLGGSKERWLGFQGKGCEGVWRAQDNSLPHLDAETDAPLGEGGTLSLGFSLSTFHCVLGNPLIFSKFQSPWQ